jgi:hypothetical protein
MEAAQAISNDAKPAISGVKSSVKTMGIKRAKNLVDEAVNELEFLAWYHQLLEIAVELEGDKVQDKVQVLIDAYLPLGKCRMEEIAFRLTKIRDELNKVR